MSTKKSVYKTVMDARKFRLPWLRTVWLTEDEAWMLYADMVLSDVQIGTTADEFMASRKCNVVIDRVTVRW